MKRTIALVLFSIMLCTSLVSAQDPLTQTYMAEDGSLSFNYPDGWVAASVFDVYHIVSNNADVVTRVQNLEDLDDFPSGAALLSIVAPNANFFYGIEDGFSLEQALVAVRESDIDGDYSYGEAESLTVGDYPAMRMAAHAPAVDGFFVAMHINQTIVVAILLSAVGEISQFDPTLLSILASVTITAPPDRLTYTSDDASFSFDYPTDWYGGGGVVTNNISTYNNEYAPGSLAIATFLPHFWANTLFPYPLPSTELAIRFADYFTGRDLAADVAEVTLGDYNAVRLSYTGDGFDGLVLVIEVSGSQILLHATMPIGELPQHEQTINALAASIRYDPSLVQIPGIDKGTLIVGDSATDSLGEEDRHLWTILGETGDPVVINFNTADTDYDAILYTTEGIRLRELRENYPNIVYLSDKTVLGIDYFIGDPPDYTLLISQPSPIANLLFGEPLPAELAPDQTALYGFSGIGGEIVSLTVSSEIHTPTFTLFGPNGFFHNDGFTLNGRTQLNVILPVNAYYLLQLERGNGPFTLEAATLTPTPLTLGETATGEYNGATVFYVLTIEAGSTHTFTADSHRFPPLLTLYTPTGQQIASGINPTVTFPNGGTYLVAVDTLGAGIVVDGPFTLRVE